MIEPLASCPADAWQCLEYIIGQGFLGIFGNPLYLGLFTIVILAIIGYALRMTGDLLILYLSLGMMIVSAEFMAFSWVTIIFLIGGAIIFFLGILRIIKSR
jgi:hypothetical protein